MDILLPELPSNSRLMFSSTSDAAQGLVLSNHISSTVHTLLRLVRLKCHSLLLIFSCQTRQAVTSKRSFSTTFKRLPLEGAFTLKSLAFDFLIFVVKYVILQKNLAVNR